MGDERLYDLYTRAYNTLRLLSKELQIDEQRQLQDREQFMGVIAAATNNDTSIRSVIVDPE